MSGRARAWAWGVVTVALGLGWGPVHSAPQGAAADASGSATTLLVDPWNPNATYDPRIPSPQAVLGFVPGERHATVDEILAYCRRLAQASDRVSIEEIGQSVEGDPLLLLTFTDPANAARLTGRQSDIELLRDPRRGSPQQRQQARERTLPATWIACSVHGDEASGADAGLLLAYQLAAGLDPATHQVLRNSVVLLDPCQNPDGRRRFVAHVRSFARALPEPDEIPAAAEHVQSWPGGRRNHYLFDLNRDWIYLTQPETRSRVAAFLRWRPQVFVDLHEMGRESSYFFPPPADPINPNVSPRMRAWWELFGRANAAAFDAQGFSYFVREAFDLFYPGYGDSWPTLQGAVGMTFEQGTTRGLRMRDASGEVLHYRDTVRRHFTSAWTTCLTAAQHGAQLLDGFESVAQDALELAARDPVRALVLDPAVHPACARQLAANLAQQGIEVLITEDELRARVRPWGGDLRAAATRRAFPRGAWVIPYDQPAYPLLRSLLDQEVALDEQFVEQERARKQRGLDDRFYDVTAWSMILSQDVAAFTCDQLPSVATRRVIATTAEPPARAPTTPSAAVASASAQQPVAWLLPYEDHTALVAACALLRQGVHVWVCREPALHDGHPLPAGTFVVKSAGAAGEDLARLVPQIAAEAGARVLATSRSWSDEGPSLGSARVSYVRPPRIAVIAGPGTRAESVGGVCWLLEQRLRYPYTTVFASSFGSLRLAELDAVLIPDLEVDALDLPLDALDAWVRGGGALVAIGKAAAWLAAAREEWTSLEPVTDLRELELDVDHDRDPRAAETAIAAARAPRKVGAEAAAPEAVGAGTDAARRRREGSEAPPDEPIPPENRPDRVPGAIARVMLDPTHFLAFGQHDAELFAPILSERIFRPSVAGWNVGVYDERVRMAGFMWPDMESALRGAAYVVDEPHGSGHLILFAEDPAFRGAWAGPSRLLLNALLLGPSLAR